VLIHHLATRADWERARETGTYTTSTRDVALEDEGYIHACRPDQWEGVRDRYYSEVTEPLVLLDIDTDLLDVPWVEEPPAPGVEETYPHLYGPLRVDAVVAVREL